MGYAKYEEDIRLKSDNRSGKINFSKDDQQKYEGVISYTKPFLQLRFNEKISCKTKKFLAQRGWKYVPAQNVWKIRYSENNRKIAHSIINL